MRLFSLGLLIVLFVPLVSHAKNVHSHQLPPHQAKVIVTFEGEIQPEVVAQYAEVLTTLQIINGLVAVIDRTSIHLLRAEPGVKDVENVGKVKAQDVGPRTRVEPGLELSLQAPLLAEAPTCTAAETLTVPADLVGPFTPGNVFYLNQEELPYLGALVTYEPAPAREEGYLAWNSVRGGDRSNSTSFGGWCCFTGWTYNFIVHSDPPLPPGEGMALDFYHHVTLTNRWEFTGQGGGPYGESSTLHDVVIREGQVTFSGFDAGLGRLQGAEAHLELSKEWMSALTLCDTRPGYDAEGQVNPEFDLHFQIGTRGSPDSWEGRVGHFFQNGLIPHKTSMACGAGTFIEWSEGGALGAPGWLDVLLCLVSPEACTVESQDWREIYLNGGMSETPDFRSFTFTPDQLLDMLDADGNLPILLSKRDEIDFWFEGGDAFDSGAMTNELHLGGKVLYDYVPSKPEVGITHWSTVSGQGSTSTIPALVGSPVSLEGTFCNAGRVGSHLAGIDWGDGTVDALGQTNGPIQGGHTFLAPGTYTIVLSVQDEYGNTGTHSIEAVVLSSPVGTVVMCTQPRGPRGVQRNLVVSPVRAQRLLDKGKAELGECVSPANGPIMCGERRGVLTQKAVPERLTTKLQGKGWTFGSCAGPVPN